MTTTVDGTRLQQDDEPARAPDDGSAAAKVPALRGDDGLGTRLNALRAGVMGANDGIVSTAGMVVGVAGASVGSTAILAAGIAATVAGALSMGVGEYISVSSQRDALKARARRRLAAGEDGLTNPWHAAWASSVSFVVGALVPLLAIIFAPEALAVRATFVAVVVALALTGGIAAHLGGAPKLRAVSRTVLGGVLAMSITWAIGALIGMQL